MNILNFGIRDQPHIRNILGHTFSCIRWRICNSLSFHQHFKMLLLNNNKIFIYLLKNILQDVVEVAGSKHSRAVKQELMMLSPISVYPQCYNQSYRLHSVCEDMHIYKATESAKSISAHPITHSFVHRKKQKDIVKIICFPLPTLKLAVNLISTFHYSEYFYNMIKF